MTVQQYYPQDMNQVAAAAQAAKDREDQFSGDGPKRYEWVDGPNYFRLLWAYSPRGVTGKVVGTHFYPPGGDPCRCPKTTWPEQNIPCAGCLMLEEVAKLRPELEIKRALPSLKWNTHCTLPDKGDETVTLVAFPKMVHNWILIQQMNPMIGNITDPGRGIILCVTRDSKTNDPGKMYSSAFLPQPYPRDAAWVERICRQMVDLDVYLRWSQEDANRNADLAAKAKIHFLGRPGAMQPGPGPAPTFQPGPGPVPTFQSPGPGPVPTFQPPGPGPVPTFQPPGPGPVPTFQPGPGPVPTFQPQPGPGPGVQTVAQVLHQQANPACFGTFRQDPAACTACPCEIGCLSARVNATASRAPR